MGREPWAVCRKIEEEDVAYGFSWIEKRNIRVCPLLGVSEEEEAGGEEGCCYVEQKGAFCFFAGGECVVNRHENAVDQDPGYEVLHDV